MHLRRGGASDVSYLKQLSPRALAVLLVAREAVNQAALATYSKAGLDLAERCRLLRTPPHGCDATNCT